jgi:Reverse transcriptase (RNA-dependent DNA polymerase)
MAFRTYYGHYEYIVMLFSLINALASMQALINDVLREFLDQFYVTYLDDILIYLETKEQHIRHIKQVLRAL